MNTFISVSAGALCGALICLGVKKADENCAVYASLLTSVLIFVALLPKISEILNTAGFFGENYFASEYLIPLIKCLGICYIAGFISDCCRRAGEKEISSHVDLCGKIAVVSLTLPYMTELFNDIKEIIEGF